MRTESDDRPPAVRRRPDGPRVPSRRPPAPRALPAPIAALLAAGAALLAACGGVRDDGASDGPYRHVVLISLDTFRADHLGCYGNPAVETPRIDALAAEATLFRDATAAAPTTLAAHTSIMTGLPPRAHGVVRNGFMVHPDNHMLAEILGRAGFLCGAVLGSFALDADFDFDQGFHEFDAEFDLLLDGEHFDQNQRRAEVVTDAALALVDRAGAGERLFLFAHYFDAHAPHDPPPPWNAKYAQPGWRAAGTQEDVEKAVRLQQRAILGPGNAPGQRQVFQLGLSRELVASAPGEPTALDRELAALYAGEVSYLDHHVGRLLDGLEERGVLRDAVVIVTGDHGETFWEHGDFWNHGLWVYDTTLRVPLIVRLPDGRGAGRVVGAPVAPLDVVPTLAELLGLELPEPVEGRSLVPALDGEELPPRLIVSEATQPVGLPRAGGAWPLDALPKSVRDGPWKYVTAPYLGLEQLFHLARDPGEQENLLERPTPQVVARRDALRAELQRWVQSHTPRPSHFNRAQFQEARARLNELGYFESGGDEDGEPDDPDGGH